MKPITKQELHKKIDTYSFPDFVIQAFNECIEESFKESFQKSRIKSSTIVIYDDSIINKIISLSYYDDSYSRRVTPDEIYKNHWLNVEDYYRQAGWNVFRSPPPAKDIDLSYFMFS